MSRIASPRVIVALDFPSAEQALIFADSVSPELCRLKIGKELFTRSGPQLVEQLQRKGFDIFLDLKYHDIPNTVARACKVAAELGVWMTDIHVSGGPAMLDAAVEAVANFAAKPLLIGVTVLTSLDRDQLSAIGFALSPAELVSKLAGLAVNAGLNGVVCSSLEAETLSATCPAGFVLVTPGIRLQESCRDDQKRIMTPARAIAAGASYLVVGRPITQATDPCQTLLTINEEFSD